MNIVKHKCKHCLSINFFEAIALFNQLLLFK